MELRPKGMLTVVETCLKLQISTGSFNKHIKSGAIRTRKKVGRVYFYDLKLVQRELQEWVNKK